MACRRPQIPALKRYLYVLRGLQLTCSVIVISLDSYFLSALDNRGLSIPTWLRAAEGIAGVTTVYLILCVLSLRFSPHVGRMLSSFGSMVMDAVFAIAAMYVASTNGYGGIGKCTQDEVDGPFGRGKADEKPESTKDGFVTLPSFGDACRIGSALLGVSVILIFLFVGSILAELWIGRNYQREKRENLINPSGEYDHSKLRQTLGPDLPNKPNFFKRVFSRKKAVSVHQDNLLPEHSHPTRGAEPMASGALNAPVMYGSAVDLDDDRQPLSRPRPVSRGTARTEYIEYDDDHHNDRPGDAGDLRRSTVSPLSHPPSPPPYRPPTHSHDLNTVREPQYVPYGEVPDAGGDLGYGARHSWHTDYRPLPRYGSHPTVSLSPPPHQRH